MIGLPGKAPAANKQRETEQEKALRKLMQERAAYAKRTGMWPSDEELMKSRKKSR